jgi:hypothetical protein
MRKKKQTTAQLLAQHNKYMTGYKTAGGASRTLTTPCCASELEVPVPKSVHEQWDSLMVCPFCGQLFMKVAWHDKVEGIIA